MKNADAAIITALPKELDAVLKLLPRFVRRESHGRLYYEAKTDRGCSLVVTCMTSMGATDAAVVTSNLLREYSPKRVLLTGIAGGLSSDVKLGDVVVSDQVVDYELGKIKDDETETRWRVFRNDPTLVHKAKLYSATAWKEPLHELLPLPASRDFEPSVHFGIVLSGNKVIANANVAGSLVSFWRKALAVEMEGAGVGAAVFHHDPAIPFTVVKGICDRADSTKNDYWQEYAAAASASYAINLLVDEFGMADMPSTPSASDSIIVSTTKITRFGFRTLIANSYDMGELKTLCFDIGVDWDEISGTTKTEKIVSLYNYCERKGKLSDLLDAVDRDTNGGIAKYEEP